MSVLQEKRRDAVVGVIIVLMVWIVPAGLFGLSKLYPANPNAFSYPPRYPPRYADFSELDKLCRHLDEHPDQRMWATDTPCLPEVRQ